MVLSSVREPAVMTLFVTRYTCPAVPPESHTVAVVVVLEALADVRPDGTVHALVEIVSPLGSHDAQLIV